MYWLFDNVLKMRNHQPTKNVTWVFSSIRFVFSVWLKSTQKKTFFDFTNSYHLGQDYSNWTLKMLLTQEQKHQQSQQKIGYLTDRLFTAFWAKTLWYLWTDILGELKEPIKSEYEWKTSRRANNTVQEVLRKHWIVPARDR